MFMVKSMKTMLRQMFSVFEPEQCLEMGNYKYNFDRNFIMFCRWNWCVFFCFFWYILFILSFSCVTIVNREMKSVSAI